LKSSLNIYNKFMSNNNINLNTPDETLVMQAIYKDAATNEPRGWSDAFTTEELIVMYNSDYVHEHWSQSNRDWLTQQVGEIIDNELHLNR